MKKTQTKDTIRNIWKEKVSFLSIMIIAMLAVAAYLGIILGSEGLKDNANNFFRELNFRDFEINSTMLLGEDDVKDLKNVEGVADVEGVYLTTGKAKKSRGYQHLSILSLTQRINNVKVTEGRLPENTKECALELDLSKILGLSVGDEITIADAKGEKPEYVLENTFTITGIVIHPDLYTISSAVPGDRYVMVLPEVFDKEALMDSYMKAIVRIEKPEGISYYSKDYMALAAETKTRLEAWSHEKEVERLDSIKETYLEKLKPAEDELAEGEKKLKEARKTLDDGASELREAESQLEDGKAQLDALAAELADGEAQLAAAESELASAEAQLQEGKSQLDSANKELVDTYNKSEEAKEEVRAFIRDAIDKYAPEDLEIDVEWIEPKYISDASASDLTIRYFTLWKGLQPIDLTLELEDGLVEVFEAVIGESEYKDQINVIIDAITQHEEYQYYKDVYRVAQSGVSNWESGHRQYIDGLAEYNAGLNEYNSGLAQYNDGLAKYNEGLAQYNEGLAQYNAAVAEIAAGSEELEKGEKEYADARAKILEGKKELEDAKKEIDELGPCHFVLLDTKGNAGFVSGEDSAVNVSKIGKTFAFLFVLLGALIIYATVGRIIDEQRNLVGAQKALGFFSGEVFRKYLTFGLAATFTGILAGFGMAYVLVEKIILVAYQQYYMTGVIPSVFRPKLAGIILVIGILLAGFAVLWACIHLLKETAKSLMQPPSPKGKKKTETKKKGGSLYSRLIIRNMITDWRRVAITMVSIAGCTVLLVIGFTLSGSISEAIKYEYDNIVVHDDRIFFDSETSEKAEEEILDILDENSVEHTEITSKYVSFDSPEGLATGELIVVNPEEIDDFFKLRDYKTKEPLQVPDEGLYITKKTSEAFDLGVGDTITVYDEKMDPYEVQVAGVFEYYFGRIFIVSQEGYEKIFGEAPTANYIWTGGDAGDESFKDRVTEVKGFESLTSTESIRERYIDQTSVLKLITYTLIFAAGLMAYFVLLNLITMYLNQKKRELTIMRVNGFTTKEVIKYVATESIITTVLGIILGLAVGSALGYSIVCFLEQSTFALMRTVNLKAWLYATLLTGAFAIAINMLALRKIKHLKLSDVN